MSERGPHDETGERFTAASGSDLAAQMVTLRGGPGDGLRVQATICSPWRFSRPILLEDSENPGVVARYRPSREKGVYTFREMDTVVARIPLEAESHG